MQVDDISAMAKERVDLAKALIRAVEKPKAKAKAGDGKEKDSPATGEASA